VDASSAGPCGGTGAASPARCPATLDAGVCAAGGGGGSTDIDTNDSVDGDMASNCFKSAKEPASDDTEVAEFTGGGRNMKGSNACVWVREGTREGRHRTGALRNER
jgi:hypothetical protein